MSYHLIKEVISLLEEFEQAGTKQDLPAFAEWLQTRVVKNQEEIPHTRWDDYTSNINAHLAMNIGVLHTHAKHYIKTALKDTELKGMHDFTFLAALIAHGDLRKSDIISKNMLEFSPGMEVIRRLLRNGLIEDYDNPEDARSRRVTITPAGRAVFAKALQKMQNVHQIVAGNLAIKEKERLLHQLRKLVAFHQPIWENEYGEDLEKIVARHIL